MEINENSENEPQSEKRTRNVVPTKFPLPDPRAEFEQHHIQIIHAYTNLSQRGSKELKYSDFTKNVLGFNPQYVSGNNKFLESIGLLKSGNKSGYYIPTESMIEFSNNLRYKKHEQAKEILRKHLLETWFYETTKNLLSMNGNVSIGMLIDELAWKSNADIDKHKKAIKAIISYLSYSELINMDVENEHVSLNGSNNNNLKENDFVHDDGNETITHVKKETIQQENVITPKKENISVTNGINVNVSINVAITPEMSEEDISNKIKAIFEGLKTES